MSNELKKAVFDNKITNLGQVVTKDLYSPEDGVWNTSVAEITPDGRRAHLRFERLNEGQSVVVSVWLKRTTIASPKLTTYFENKKSITSAA